MTETVTEMTTFPEMHPVKSSTIAAIGYDSGKNELFVQFRSGSSRMYSYKGVSQDLYEQLLQSDSVGKFFHGLIKKNYEFTNHTPKKEDTQ